jgi:hypothetical protein
VHGGEIEIHGKTTAAVALLASGSDPTLAAGVKSPDAVLVSAGDWLPWLAPCEIEVPGLWADLPGRVKQAKLRKLPRILATLALAREFQRLLTTGDAPNRAALARRFAPTRARVSQIMKVLNLAPEVIAHIETVRTPVSERALRAVFGATPGQQLGFVRSRQTTASPDGGPRVRVAGSRRRTPFPFCFRFRIFSSSARASLADPVGDAA